MCLSKQNYQIENCTIKEDTAIWVFYLSNIPNKMKETLIIYECQKLFVLLYFIFLIIIHIIKYWIHLLANLRRIFLDLCIIRRLS